MQSPHLVSNLHESRLHFKHCFPAVRYSTGNAREPAPGSMVGALHLWLKLHQLQCSIAEKQLLHYLVQQVSALLAV